MKEKIVVLFVSAVLMTACGSKATVKTEATDTVVAELPDLVGDTLLTNTAKYYADMVDAGNSTQTLEQVDSLISKDMQDLRDTCNFVFYPFSGPDFFYPYTMFPDADVYFLFGLEPTGRIINTRETDGRLVNSYKTALYVYFNNSFFITPSMRRDLDNGILDGTVPVISMQMAKKDCQIISIQYKDFAEGGKIVDAAEKGNLVEFRFFSNKTPKHLQTLYYYSGDVSDESINNNFKAYVNATLPHYRVCSFFKAASYLLHYTCFSQTRDLILNHSMAIIGDDSGMPYRFLRKDWDITVYGIYKRPLALFAEDKNQKDLDSLYKSGVAKPLSFKIGYNTPSNWMVSRKK